MPRFSAVSSFSMIVTGMPTLTKFIEMPPPMVPAPITAARLISRGCVSLSMPGTLLASRSAKKMWRCAFDWSPTTSFMNRSRSFFCASSIGVSSVMRTASIAAAGACRPRVFFACCATILSNFAGLARISSSLSSRSFTRWSGRFAASTLRANLTAPATRSPSIISSTSPAAIASLAGIGSPDRIIGSAFSMPTRRGSRCVPPAPGINPSLISGKPSRVPAAATRKWQPMVSSRPPPSGVPCTAAIVGFLMSSSVVITSIRPGACGGLPNSVMSAPATNVRPAPVSTIASTLASSRAAMTLSKMPLRTPCRSAFTGGLSMVMMATLPSRRMLTGLSTSARP